MDMRAYIEQVVATAPPLTEEQVARVGSLLRCTDVVSQPMVVSLDD